MEIQRVKGWISQDETVDLLRKMVQFKTVNEPGDEKPLAEMLAGVMSSIGMEVELVDLGNNRANVIGVLKGTGEKNSLLFNGHLDTVPPGDVEWNHGPYSGDIENGKIYGRGTTDMKGGLASMIMAAKAIKQAGAELKGDLIIAATAGEEIDSIGAFDYLHKTGLKGVGAIVIGEPSSCGINVAEKGAFWIEITTYGATAHGAFPDRGKNAIVYMNALINRLLQYQFSYEENPLLGHPTMNISTIKGGVKTNVVPDKCTITVDIRTVPGINHDDLIKDVEGMIEGLKGELEGFEASIQITNNRPAVETAVDHPFVKLAQDVIKEEFDRVEEPKGVNFYTDAAVFLPATHLPAVIYGPGDADMAHQPNEYVEIDSLVEAAQFYAALIEKYLAN
ncbi:M20 family metallopeptidase [Neobacillus mesonae]|uniref:M20 family metallopeptidase n=1 Tax=Neobacillus mesonae TaxID=1193713 RepID=UPI00203D860B|nr:M20 family metallopeptidase [Neobacillus mesonae]MCM3571453.1 M20 family metallopeptidase [Neobacillus mesonae]